ncbi:MAG: AAA family ATPase [Candidatus Aenigmarchaeota archaeon]|nr:AAA family ATPase [Candidatus Aenigmarchaeota archaeon]
MIVIGLTGYAGSGKTTVAKYLNKKYGFTVYMFSQIVEREARKMGLLRDGTSLEEKKRILSEVGAKIREKYGRKSIFAEMLVGEINNDRPEKVCVDGFRSEEEVETFRKNFPKFLLIFLHADPEKRYERRKAEDPGMKMVLEEFLERDERDKKIIGMDKMEKLANIIIYNSGTLEELYKKIDEVVSEIEQ